MTIVRDVLRDAESTPEHPAGRPVGGVRVWARLHAASDWLADGTGQVVKDSTTVTHGVTGEWQLDLVPHHLLEDSDGSWYEIWFPVLGTRHSIRIPQGAGPWGISQILVDPDTLEPVETDLDPFYVPTTWVGTLVAPVGPGGRIPSEFIPPGDSAPFVYHQQNPQSVWGPIQHNFGYRPAAVSLWNEDFSVMYEEYGVQHLDQNTIRISADTPASGWALIR